MKSYSNHVETVDHATTKFNEIVVAHKKLQKSHTKLIKEVRTLQWITGINTGLLIIVVPMILINIF